MRFTLTAHNVKTAKPFHLSMLLPFDAASRGLYLKKADKMLFTSPRLRIGLLLVINRSVVRALLHLFTVHSDILRHKLPLLLIVCLRTKTVNDGSNPFRIDGIFMSGLAVFRYSLLKSPVCRENDRQAEPFNGRILLHGQLAVWPPPIFMD
ncbi:hypothetical protein [Superficieibacter sp. HKU1]|uniref:hypothetical protein n=1 Tax=Superficieibacter sp. HKU1 TaxID=3031919 RepID=UPI0023E34931|nr:hypothetical protein [Superficieibacter sp. HKU1]WES67905.1 hypothetical protein P0H77_20230 [Superficieibacter sp. HKU1]